MKLIWPFKTVLLFTLLSFKLSAQDNHPWKQKPVLNISGFADVFYVYDFNQPQGTERQPFLFNHNRHNTFNLNMGFVKLAVDHRRYRANLALQAGTYATDNYAAEPGILKHLFEANAGISLNKRQNLWLDAGVFASHIGFESAISIDNSTMTRSILAENSPYYLSGAKLTFTPSTKLEIVALLLNGWQRIHRLAGQSLPSFGTQLKYSPTAKTTLNWSTFIGTNDPDSTRRMRYFNNFYGQFQLSKQLSLITGFDIGAQQSTKGSLDYGLWFSPVIIGQYTINSAWKTAIRAEYYQDKTGIMIFTGTQNGFRTTGLSLNFDYAPSPKLVCRLEGRLLKSREALFETKTLPTNNNLIIGASIAFKFSEKINKQPNRGKSKS